MTVMTANWAVSSVQGQIDGWGQQHTMAELSNGPRSRVHNTDWQHRAACRDTDTEAFFNPDYLRGRNKRAREAAAKAICAGCPVREACLEWAVYLGETHGVWGGLTPEERVAVGHELMVS
jgi:WhiB family transcriptional regulator, redox-sensing transcriptional regulator